MLEISHRRSVAGIVTATPRPAPPGFTVRAVAALLAGLLAAGPAVARADFKSPPTTATYLPEKEKPKPAPEPVGPPPGPAEPVAVVHLRTVGSRPGPALDTAGLYGAIQGAGIKAIMDGRARALLAGDADPWSPAGRGARLLDSARTALGALDYPKALMLAEQALGLLGLADTADEARLGLIAGHAVAIVATEGLPDSPARRRATAWHAESLRRLWALTPESKDPARVPPGLPAAVWGRLPVAAPPGAPRKVTVGTDPAGALVSVDTSASQPAPAVLSLPPGRHLLTARADGRTPALRWLDVTDRDVEVALALGVPGPDPLADAANAARHPAAAAIDNARLLTRAGRLAGAERLVILQANPQSEQWGAFSFDIRTGQRSTVRDLALKAPSGALAAFVVEVAKARVLPAGSIGAVAAVPQTSDGIIGRSSDKSLPFYRKWWFWAAIGLAAAIVLIATQEGKNPNPSTITLRVERK
jgi:hypothetical protein